MPTYPHPGPSLRTQWVGDRLRKLRKQKKMSLKSVGDYLQRDASTISRYEAGEFPVRRGDMLGLLDLFGVSSEQERNDMIQLGDESWRRGWWDQHRADFGSSFINIPWIESRALTISAYEHMMIHGLLQTRAYAEEVTRIACPTGTSEHEIERLAELRLQRQEVIRNESATSFSCIMEEVALHRLVGSREVMDEQLKHLLMLGDQGHITIRIYPTSAGLHKANSGRFVIYELPEPYPAIAHAETLGGSLYLEEESLKPFTEAWENLDKSALSAKESVELIRNHLKETK